MRGFVDCLGTFLCTNQSVSNYMVRNVRMFVHHICKSPLYLFNYTTVIISLSSSSLCVGKNSNKQKKSGWKGRNKMLNNVCNGEEVGRINKERDEGESRQQNDKAIWLYNS
jgi:hypothetical protein